ncbi:putative protein kinase RLK-Pelle-DLSV family [Rosa chinensis]|uniref:non-specific serine/threonine protein kinase n=1 Tax=Rosa chinensis TaxID=74649 RepID=A0A2P6PAA1_ROSCH|nr:putative protein kinase RLK-Pelle-DLSV family [Rosa chinensis]PRQ18848.1 putative protein kinase RLK-Pelle-DLSV family [Rosa chinensis]
MIHDDDIHYSDVRRLLDCRMDYCEEEREDMELPLFDFTTIADATDNFSSNNKLGQGGFGPVYKGTLIGGKEIAVKRRSKESGQGMREFKNEVILIAKLQHRNLVQLLGCCIQNDEKMLIYEYTSNRSLDFFIFGMILSKLNYMDLQSYHPPLVLLNPLGFIHSALYLS